MTKMRIGITFDLKTSGLADDSQEEFDSPHTIDAIAAALGALGHDVVFLGDGPECLQKLLNTPIDLVFNFAEGHGISRSREARIPAVLDMLGIPYTGSDPLTMAVTLDKDIAKRLVACAGVKVPRGRVITPDRQRKTTNGELTIANCQFPVIVKPAWEGSSKGIRNKCVAHSQEELAELVEEMCATQRQPVLVEDFIEGDELTVGILGNDPPEILGVMRIVPRAPTTHFVYSLEVKRDYRRQVRYECPPQLDDAVIDRVREDALRAYHALGCRDVARIDFRLRTGVPYFLEVNPLPGLNPDDSDLVIMARLVGCTHGQLIAKIVQSAMTRCAGAREPAMANHAGRRATRTVRS